MSRRDNKWKKGAELLGNTAHGIILIVLAYFALMAIADVDRNLAPLDICGRMAQIASHMGINEIFTFIGAIAFILFGVVGIYEFLYSNGLHFLAPPMFISFKEKTDLKQAEQMMRLYYERDIEFIKMYERERTDFLLQALGLEEKQFRNVNYEIIKARVQADANLEQLQDKAEKILLCSEFIVDQSKLECSKRVYIGVNYFINLYTAMYKPRICEDAGNIMARFL